MDLSEYLLEVFSSEKQSDLFDSFLRAIPDFVYLLDLTDGKIKYLNEKTGIVAYYTEDEVLSLDKSFFPVKNYSNRDEFIDKINLLFQGLETGDHRSFTLDLITKEGKRHIVRNRGTLLKKTKDGMPSKVVVIAEDITLEVESDEREKQKQFQLDSAESLFKYGSWEWTLGTEFVTWSNGLFDIFGYDSTKYPDSKMPYGVYNQHIVEEDKESVKLLSHKAIANKEEYYEFEHSIIDEKGNRKLIAVKGKCYFDKEGSVIRVLGTSEDITELNELKDNLSQKIEELNRSNQDLEQFAYVASHDLQEPLRKIMAFGDRLQSKYGDELGTDGQFYLSRMLDAANRMKILMENLLSYSRVSSKTESFELVDLGLVIESILSDLEMKIQDIDAEITMTPMPTLNALPTQMQQLFQNLISNALKFVRPNVKSVISIEASEADRNEMSLLGVPFKNSRYYKIEVRDNGIGFDNDYTEKIFLIFQRLHGRSEFEGTGLGLAICKKIVDNHQGFITAKSELNKGAVFTVYLPDEEV
jgi:PAS domain S-box-containing protein